ncbi:MAG: DUF4190 domain-containing protein [Actinobacteria bacterium]|nr:DUF4190 domain-containing protein [Actinomycetota bacterium]
MTGFEGSGTWERDPYDRYPLRWWDGTAWSDQVSVGDGLALTDPQGAFATVAPLPAVFPTDPPSAFPTDPPSAFPTDPFGSPPPPIFVGGHPLGGAPAAGSGAFGAPPPPPPGNVAPQYGGYVPYAPPQAAPGSSGVAIAALICGLIGLCAGLIPILGYLGVPLMLAGIICGIIGLSKTKAGQSGRGLAIAGIVTGALGLVAVVLWTVLFVVASDDSMNSDPSDGVCNDARYWEDPDC